MQDDQTEPTYVHVTSRDTLEFEVHRTMVGRDFEGPPPLEIHQIARVSRGYMKDAALRIDLRLPLGRRDLLPVSIAHGDENPPHDLVTRRINRAQAAVS